MPPKKPGWTEWRTKSSDQKVYRQLWGNKDELLCTQWRDTGRYVDKDNHPLAAHIVRVLEESIPRFTQNVTINDPGVSSGNVSITGEFYGTLPSPSLNPPQGNKENLGLIPSPPKSGYLSTTTLLSPPGQSSGSAGTQTKPTKDVKDADQALGPGEDLSAKQSWDLISNTGTLIQLTPDFKIRHASFFEKGRVFRVLWAEPKGNNAPHVGDGEVYQTFRPMVVVKQYDAHCMALPVFSHGGQGVSKKGLSESEIRNHAVIHIEGSEPKLLPREKKWESTMQQPFTVKVVGHRDWYDTSRLRFDMAYPVKYNLKVCNIGLITGAAQLSRLTTCWDEASS